MPHLSFSACSLCTAKTRGWHVQITSWMSGIDPILTVSSMLLCDVAVGGVQVYMFGGRGTRGLLNDVWVYDVLKNQWASASHPVSRQGRPAPRLTPLLIP